MLSKSHKILIIMAGLGVLCSDVVLAQAGGIVDDNILAGIITQYRNAANGWGRVITRHASQLFWGLAVFEIVYTGIELLFDGADIKRFFGTVVRRVLFIGFFWNILTFSGTWMQSIVDSFREIGAQASEVTGGSRNLSPDDIFDSGLDLTSKILDSVSAWDPIDSLSVVLCALVILLCFALIAAFMLVALVEMYIVLNAGIILLGFGSTRFTNDYTTNFLKYVISVGMKLMIMQLLVGIGENFILQMAENIGDQSFTQIFVIIGSSLVLLVLVKSVPEMLQAVINGGNFSTGNGLAASGGAAIGATVGAAAGSIGGAMAVKEAAKLSGAQGAAGSLGVAKQMMSNLSSHALGDISGRFSGVPGSTSGTMGGRMANRMKEERMAMSDDSISKGKPDSSYSHNPNVSHSNALASYISPLNAYGNEIINVQAEEPANLPAQGPNLLGDGK